ncbi:hypothetical protein J0A68_20715 [Algoriphagus sp. H41]|uniref:Lipoprotein n=1 Tax=Algoriphagus oliviformis TaxID=2811231 RepID=A0ABS3C9B0_9BACT|nr:hypothetical protein [Algoriphagus oliviformis]MBN7813390.1 hypothetical protein [Algoriphagus oliviformis]
MKKTLIFRILLGFIALTMFGCSTSTKSKNQEYELEALGEEIDSSEDYPYYIQAQVDGELIKFNDPDLLQFSMVRIMAGVHQASIVGGELDEVANGSRGGFTIFIKDSDPITTKRYDFLEPFEETGFGLKGATIGYYTEGHQKNYVSDVEKEAPVVIISELTGEYARGTFGGKVYDIVKKDMVTITEGEFYVERLN